MMKDSHSCYKSYHARLFAKLCLILTACVLALTGCDKLNSSPEKLQAQAKKFQQVDKAVTLTRGIIAPAFELDPHRVKNSAEGALARDLLVGLVAFDTHGNIVPAMAQSWFSEDNQSWLFVLDEQATWSNGEPVTAHDFVLSWQRLAQEKSPFPLANYLIYMGVKNAQAVILGQKSANELGVEALNANTLKITLDTPNAQLPNMLAHIALLPTYQGEKPQLSSGTPTNGSYVIDEVQENKIKLATRQIETPFSEVEYHLLTPAQLLDAMDLVENPAPTWKKEIVKLPRLCTYFYEFNFKNPQLSQKAVRQAIKVKIHSARIAGQYGLVNDAILPQTLRPETERQWQPVVFERLLTQAGIRSENPLKLTLTYDDQGQHSAIANQIIRTLSESDLVRVQPQAVDFPQLLAKHAAGEFDLIRAGWCADYPDPASFLWQFHSASPDNKTHYRNENVDKALERLKNTKLTETERKQLIGQITNQLESDVAILPLFQYQKRLKVNSTLLGIEPKNASEVIYSKDLSRHQTENDKETNEPTN